MKIKALIPISNDGKAIKAGTLFDIEESQALSLVKAGAAVLVDSKKQIPEKTQTPPLTPLTAQELADALFDKHGEFTVEDFRKDSQLPKADAVRRVLERDDVGGDLLEQALGLLEDKLKEE